MRVALRTEARHRCPFADEADIGTVELVYDHDPAEGVYDVREVVAFLASFTAERITHEDYTAALAQAFPGCTITTRFVTAGVEVVCTHAVA